MGETLSYTIPAMHCGHCARAVKEEVSAIAGMSEVAVDLETKIVIVTGSALDDVAVRAALEEAGYEAA
jgi:copper chaperone